MFFSTKKFTTIDIGSFTIKVARFKQKKNNLQLLQTAYRHLPLQTIKDNNIKEPSIIANTLEDIFSEMKYKPEKIVTCISSDNLVTRNMELPVMEKEELAEAIKWEAEDYLPFPVEQAKLDYLLLDKDKEIMKLLLVAIKETVVDNFLQPFKQLSLQPEVVNVQPLALLSLLKYKEKLTEVVAIVDIGASGTRVVIGDNNNVYLSRTIDTGGEDFTQALMDSKGIDFQEAEAYKIEKGIEEETLEQEEEDDDLLLTDLNSFALTGNNIYHTLTGDIAKELSRSLKYFAMENREKQIKNIYLTGGGSKLKGLAKSIGKELEVELLPIYPGQSLGTNLEYGEHFAVAIGLGISEVFKNES